MTAKLSVCIITKNAQTCLSAMLRSVAFADELIVVDDNSDDQTREVAIAHGAQVYVHGLEKNFAQQRNFALSQASHEWVLFVDADEVVTKSLRTEIMKAILQPETVGFLLKRQDTFLGRTLRYGETAHNRFLRLARKEAGRWVRPVHEVWQVEGKIGQLSSPLEHQSASSITSFINKINHYTQLEADYRVSQSQHTSIWDITFTPTVKFLYNYVYLQGWRDGFPGLAIAFLMSLHSLSLRIKWHAIAS